VDCGDDADSIIQFQLERGGDRMKRCRKMKWRRRGGVATSVGGEVALGRGKGGHDAN
jgi:hypothetical protein